MTDQSKRRLSFMVDPELFDRIEAARGLVKRETWLRAVVEAATFGPVQRGAEERVLPQARGETFEEALPEGHPARRIFPPSRGPQHGVQVAPPLRSHQPRSHASNCKCPVCA